MVAQKPFRRAKIFTQSTCSVVISLKCVWIFNDDSNKNIYGAKECLKYANIWHSYCKAKYIGTILKWPVAC